MTDPGSQPQLVVLPSASRAGWLLVALVGLALLGVGGHDLATHASVLAAEPRTRSFLALGAGLFLAWFTVVVLSHRPAASAVRLAGQRGAVAIESRDGAAVDLPWDAIERVVCLRAAGSRGACVLALIKRDGGLLELATYRDDEQARATATILRRALETKGEASPGDEPGAGEPAAPTERLARGRGVTVHADGDQLSLRWRARSSAWALAAVGCFGGLAVVSYGFLREGYGVAVFALAAMVALAGGMAGGFLHRRGLQVRITIDDQRLVIEQLRFGRTMSRTAIALSSIVAVDCTHQLSTAGAGLAIRTGDDGEDRQGALALTAAAHRDEADPQPDAKVGLALMQLVQGGIHLPAGRLSLATQIALELTMAEAVARRRGTGD